MHPIIQSIVSRRWLAGLLLLTLVPAWSQPAPRIADHALLLANRRVLWLGDSITHDGKYVSFVEYYLKRRFPDQYFDFVSIGLSSETVSGLTEKDHPFPRPCLAERQQRALDKVKPAAVIACYGMNDGIYHPQSPERLQAFQEGVRRLSAAVRDIQGQFILLTPPPFDALPLKNLQKADAPDFSYQKPYEKYDRVLEAYSQWEKALPAGEARLVVDFHSALQQYIAGQRATCSTFSFTTDGIHPNAAGHLLMAQTFLHAIGVQIETGALEQELARIEADPLFQLIRERREKRSNGWLAYVGYTRGERVESKSIAQTEQTAAKMQARIERLSAGQP